MNFLIPQPLVVGWNNRLTQSTLTLSSNFPMVLHVQLLPTECHPWQALRYSITRKAIWLSLRHDFIACFGKHTLLWLQNMNSVELSQEMDICRRKIYLPGARTDSFKVWICSRKSLIVTFSVVQSWNIGSVNHLKESKLLNQIDLKPIAKLCGI